MKNIKGKIYQAGIDYIKNNNLDDASDAFEVLLFDKNYCDKLYRIAVEFLKNKNGEYAKCMFDLLESEDYEVPEFYYYYCDFIDYKDKLLTYKSEKSYDKIIQLLNELIVFFKKYLYYKIPDNFINIEEKYDDLTKQKEEYRNILEREALDLFLKEDFSKSKEYFELLGYDENSRLCTIMDDVKASIGCSLNKISNAYYQNLQYIEELNSFKTYIDKNIYDKVNVMLNDIVNKQHDIIIDTFISLIKPKKYKEALKIVENLTGEFHTLYLYALGLNYISQDDIYKGFNIINPLFINHPRYNFMIDIDSKCGNRFCFYKTQIYYDAQKDFKKRKYDDARKKFLLLGGFFDSINMVKKCETKINWRNRNEKILKNTGKYIIFLSCIFNFICLALFISADLNNRYETFIIYIIFTMIMGTINIIYIISKNNDNFEKKSDTIYAIFNLIVDIVVGILLVRAFI